MTRFATSIEQLSSFPERLYTRPALKKLFLQYSGIPDWLLTRCQKEGCDLAETLARCWPVEGTGLSEPLSDFLSDTFPELRSPEKLLRVWNQCKTSERIGVNRLLLGHHPETKREREPDPNLPRKVVQAELMYAVVSGSPEYSFGLKRKGDLQIFARVTVEDIKHSEQLLQFIEKNTTEKKGPVRVVRPGLVGRISYVGLVPSTRHKSGLKVEGARLESLYPPGGLWQADTFSDV